MVRVKITPRKRNKRVRFLDEVQADSSRPRASYTPSPTSDADVLKFIQKKAAEQRQTQPWWEKLASPTKQQWAYANAYHRAEEYAKKRGALRSPPKKKKTTPTRGSSSTDAQEETPQTQDLHDPDGIGPVLSQHCPASVFSSQTIDLQFFGGTRPSQQTESEPVAIKGPCPCSEGTTLHHERD